MKLFVSLATSLATIVFSINVFAVQTKFNRVIVFGDSLSDVGTYSPVAAFKGGGKFTTNPGKLWAEHVAVHMGLPMKPNRHEGFGIPFRKVGGFNFAQGGAKVAAPGEQSNFSARSVAEQLGYYVTDYKTFLPTDIVLVQGGANDVLGQLKLVQNKSISVEKAIENMAQTADAMASIITSLSNAGARSIVALNLPQIEKTPKALEADVNTQLLIAKLVMSFNQTLAIKTAGLNLLLVDVYVMDQHFNENFAQYGFESASTMACKMDAVFAGTSLFCGPKQLVKPNADQVRKFADNIHPASGYSKWIGDRIWEVMKIHFELE